jgi:hypothetical protein
MADFTVPATFNKWTIKAAEAFAGLELHENVPIPAVGDSDVLVKFYAASLNYRDIAISRVRLPTLVSWLLVLIECD